MSAVERHPKANKIAKESNPTDAFGEKVQTDRSTRRNQWIIVQDSRQSPNRPTLPSEGQHRAAWIAVHGAKVAVDEMQHYLRHFVEAEDVGQTEVLVIREDNNPGVAAFQWMSSCALFG